jgi:hypothetical protein
MPVREHVRSTGCYEAGCGRRRRYVLRASTVEHVRVEVESVGPDDRTQLRVDADLVEDGRVAEPLAHRTPRIGGEVDDSFAAVIEDQTELVAVEGLDGGYGDHATDAGQRVDAGQLWWARA